MTNTKLSVSVAAATLTTTVLFMALGNAAYAQNAGTGSGSAGQTGAGQAQSSGTGAPTANAGGNAGGINAGQTDATTNRGTQNSSPETGAMSQEPGGTGNQSPARSAQTNVGTGSLGPRKTASADIVYDLARTITDGLAGSSDLVIAARNVEIDRKRADEASAAGRPTLGATATATRFDQETRVRIGNGPPAQVLGTHTEQLSLNASERIDLFGQIRASANQAFLQSTADQFLYQSIRNARILRAKSIYFNLLRAQHQLQVAQAALLTAQRQLQVAQYLNAGQVGQKIDVYRAATQVANNQQQVTGADNNRLIAEQNFNDLVGRPLATPVRVLDVPGVTVGTPVMNTSSVGASTPAFAPFTVPASVITSLDIEKSLQTANISRPELLIDQVNVRVAQTGITLARAGLQPTFVLNASGNYFPTTSFQTPRQRTAAVTATVNIPLYDGGATRDRIAESRLRTENAATQLDSDRSGVALDVRQSYLNLLTTARQIDAANTALQQSIAARQLAQVRYEGQVGLYLEVTDAEAALVQAENSQVNAVYDYLVAQAQFENAIGQPRIP